ncbi:MAG: hypothetical protein ACKVW3_12245 [Phycisphaerales bacterium]
MRIRGWAFAVVLSLATAVHAGKDTPGDIERARLGPARPVAVNPASLRAADPASGSWRLVGSLAVVITLALGVGVGLRVLAKRSPGLRAALGAGGRAPAGVVEVLGRYPVARGATLVLLRLDRRILLLSQSSGGRLGLSSSFSTLCEVADPDDVASLLVKTRDDEGESMSRRFQSLLDRFDRAPAERDEATVGVRTTTSSRGGIPVVDLTRRPGEQGMLSRRLAAIRTGGKAGGG